MGRVASGLFRAMVVWMALAAVPVAAQHAEGAGLVLAPEFTGCGFCHGPHTASWDAGSPGGGRYALRTDRLPGLLGVDAAAGMDPGPVSRSCLRCHLEPEIRLRQPEMEGAGIAATTGGTYLRTDFSDDHPVGSVGGGREPLVDPTFRNPATTRLWSSGRSMDSFGRRELACTTCHDPHDRAGSTLGRERQRVLCGACHEPAVYGSDVHAATLACGDCHGMHGGSRLSLLAERDSNLLCGSCHGGAPPVSDRAVSAAARSPGPVGHVQPPKGQCVTCHPAHR